MRYSHNHGVPMTPKVVLDIVFQSRSISPEKVWSLLVEVEPKLANATSCFFYDHLCRLSDVPELLSTWEKPHFDIEADGFQIHCGQVFNDNHSFVQIRGLFNNELESEPFIIPFTFESGFVSGWLFEEEYDKWQNAQDVLVYNAAGRDHSTLPKVSNNLPYPLTQDVVDISQNPGKRIIMEGFVEAVGSTMWLGASFLKLVNLSPQVVQSAPWLDVLSLPNGVLRLQAYPVVFTEDFGKQSVVQENLRQLLYSNAK